jgi:hypothetical protein
MTCCDDVVWVWYLYTEERVSQWVAGDFLPIYA